MAENTAFDSLYAHGFARVAAVTLPVAIADPVTNASRIVAAARQAHARGVAVAVFPELALTGYAIDDLLLQDALLEAWVTWPPAATTWPRSARERSNCFPWWVGPPTRTRR